MTPNHAWQSEQQPEPVLSSFLDAGSSLVASLLFSGILDQDGNMLTAFTNGPPTLSPLTITAFYHQTVFRV